MNAQPFSGVEKHNGLIHNSPTEQDTRFLRDLDKLLWQHFRQTLPEVLSDLYRQNTISTPSLSVERIIKELSKISSVNDVMTPLLRQYKKEV